MNAQRSQLDMSQKGSPRLASSEAGQSMIETIVAIFILTTAMTGGLGLAIYAYSGSRVSDNEIIATNLAREGVEVVRMMRDSNWLAGDAKGGAWSLTACADIAKNCYPFAYTQVTGYNLYNLTAGNKRVKFTSGNNTWAIDSVASYDLYLQNNGSYTPTANGTSVFGRMINISLNTNIPYTNQNSNQELIVKSVVAWRGKNCTSFVTATDLLILATPCKIIVEEHLTNWKDYQ